VVYSFPEENVTAQWPDGHCPFQFIIQVIMTLSSPNCPDLQWDPPSLLLDGYWGFFPGIKWPECEVDHSPTSNAEVKKE
jgi:hypothetical protein